MTLRLTAFLLSLAGALGAGQADYGSGGAATWMMLAGTRSLAVGPAALLLADDASLLGSDPGGLAWQPADELGLHHGLWQAGASWDQLSLRQAVDGATQLGVAAGLTSYEPMDRVDANGITQGTYNAGEALAAGGLARRLGSLGLGASALLSRQTLDSSVDYGYAWALGLDWRPAAWLGLAMAFRSATEGLDAGAWSFDGGARLGPGDWRVAVDAHVEGEAPKRLQVAGTRRFRAGDWGLEVLAGWGLDVPDADLGAGSGWTSGLSVQWQAWSLDYAFVPLGELEPQHHLGLRYTYGAAASRPAPAPPRPTPEATPPPVQVPVEPPISSLPLPSPTPEAVSGIDVLVLSEGVEQGEAHEALGRTMAALASYRGAAEKDSSDLAAWRHLAQLYGRLGRQDFAKQCWQQVQRLAPSDPALREPLQRP